MDSDFYNEGGMVCGRGGTDGCRVWSRHRVAA